MLLASARMVPHGDDICALLIIVVIIIMLLSFAVFWAPKSAEWICGGFFELNFSQIFPKQNLPTPTRVHLVAQNFWTLCLGVAVVVVFCFAAICWF